MATPDFRVIANDDGEGVTYTCGCPCVPVARPTSDGSAGHEHCCCGKVHFAGTDARSALEDYLAGRKAKRKREPEYELGTTSVALDGREVEVAWAFPRE